jgi:hypothetical protein
MMGWLSKGDRSDRVLALGVVLALTGFILAIAGDRIAPTVVSHAAAWVLLVMGGLAGLVGLLLAGLDQEALRTRRRVEIGRYYGEQAVRTWISLPPSGKVAVGVVLPAMVIAFSVLALVGVTRQVMAAVLTSSMVVFIVLLSIASRRRR